MTQNAIQLLDQALLLPSADRADVAAKLLESLDQEVDEGAASAWSEEIANRLNELDSGKVTPIPWPEARRRIQDLSDAAFDA